MVVTKIQNSSFVPTFNFLRPSGGLLFLLAHKIEHGQVEKRANINYHERHLLLVVELEYGEQSKF